MRPSRRSSSGWPIGYASAVLSGTAPADGAATDRAAPGSPSQSRGDERERRLGHRTASGPHPGRSGGRSLKPGSGGVGDSPSSPSHRRSYWSGMSPQPQYGSGVAGGAPRGSRGAAPASPPPHTGVPASPQTQNN